MVTAGHEQQGAVEVYAQECEALGFCSPHIGVAHVDVGVSCSFQSFRWIGGLR